MQGMIRSLVVATSLLAAAPAMAQLSPEPPPPPPPPEGVPPPAQPAYGGTKLKNNVLRASGGVSFAAAGYYCGYYYYYYSCSSGFSTALPDVNLDFDLGVSPSSALGLGVNVMWGSYHSVDLTVWEPHVDYLLRGAPTSPVRGRFRIGVGLYVSSGSGKSQTGQSVSSSSVGGAFRIGGGISLFNNSPVGLGLDAIFEAGAVRGYYASTIQLLAGPEFHL